MSWPANKPPRPYVSPGRVLRRGLRDAAPVVRASTVDVVPPVLAVLIGIVLRSELPRKGFWAGSGRDVVALVAAAVIYILGRVVVDVFRAPRRLRADWFAWSEGSGENNVVLKFASPNPDGVACLQVCCEVTDPDGGKSFWAQSVYEIPGYREVPLFFNYPSRFPNAAPPRDGWYRATWWIQEDFDSDQWLEVASKPFTFFRPPGAVTS